VDNRDKVEILVRESIEMTKSKRRRRTSTKEYKGSDRAVYRVLLR
jgi:hypothetical protein